MKMRNMTIMHRKYLALEQYHCNYNNTITVGVTAESAVMLTVIVASCTSALIVTLQEEEERAHDYLCF